MKLKTGLILFALTGLLVLNVKGVSSAYFLSQSVSLDSGIYTYDFVGSLNNNEISNEFDLWLNQEWNADNDGVLEAGENYEITSTPVGWSSFGFHFPFQLAPLNGDPSLYTDLVHWESNGGFVTGPLDVIGFQVKSRSVLLDPAYSWGDVGGHLPEAAVPEPGTLFLVGFGLIGGLGLSRRQKNIN